MKVKNCSKWITVNSAEEASKIIRATIDNDGTLGANRWYGFKQNGHIVEDGRTIAQISYNGRIWPAEGWQAK